MSLFSKIFGNSTERKVNSIITEIHKKVEVQTQPLHDLGFAIIKASDECAKAANILITCKDEKEHQKLEVFVFYEFVYFFMHLTMRSAFSQLDQTKLKNLQQYIGPVVANTAINSFFKHWPEETKKNMQSEFFDKLNEVEIEYSKAKILAKKGDPFSEDSLFGKLARNVTELVCDNMDPITMFNIVDVSTRVYMNLELDSLVKKASPSL